MDKIKTSEIHLTNMKNEESDDSEETKSSTKVEDIYEQLGGFSRFQFFATVVILCLEIPGAMVALSPILTTTSRVDFYCETGNQSSILLARDELCSYACKGNITAKKPFNSIVQEWRLICDDAWIADSLTSLFMIGSALGPLITAQIADRFGRKPAFFIVCLLLGASGIFASQTTSVAMYAVSKLLSGIASGGCMVAHMNYLMEFLTPSWRIICGCVSMWPVGEMLLALVGYLSPDWRTLSWASVVPAILLLLTFPFLPESPRWLLCRNKTNDAGLVLNSMAKWNRRPHIQPETLEQLQKSVLSTEDSENFKTVDKWAAFKDMKILLTISIFFMAWFSNAVTYYGISFNMKNMSGNPYFNVFLLGVLDSPAELSGMYFSNRFGRKISFIGFLLVSVVCLVAVAGIEFYSSGAEDAKIHFGTVVLVLCLAGRFFNETSFAIMTCFTGESFPTIIRSICFSICTVASSLGGIISPQMAYLGFIWAPGPYVIFCSICTISCIFSLKLEETKKKPLQDIK